MNDQKQLIAIAEFCGWKWHGDEAWIHSPKDFYWKNGDTTYSTLPDYPNDLNALHAAWLLLSDEQKRDFWSTLRTIMHGEKPLVEVLYNYLTPGATPAQFREALLRTIGKWEDGE